MSTLDVFGLFERRWPPALDEHRDLVRRYLTSLKDQGFGLRQSVFISSNIAGFLDHLRRTGTDLATVARSSLEDYLRQTPYNLATDNGKARRTYLLRFLAFAWPHRAGEFQRTPRYGPPQRPFGDLGDAFFDFNRRHRGVQDATLDAHRVVLVALEKFLARRGITDLRRLSLKTIDAFFLAQSRGWSPAAQKQIVGSLRNFLRFLYLKGVLRENLAPRVMPPSLFRRSLRPKYLPWNQIEGFLASIDRSTPLGRRDYAMALLMATLGLRARELARLRVRDMDLAGQRLFLPERKGGRPDLFPLSPALADALRDYLTVRPVAPHESLFLSVRPPVKPLGHEIRTTVAARLARFFGRPRSARVYLLRHSFAKHLLDNGAPLPAIGQILGHRSLSSTLVYTQVDVKSLREVADNYADLLPEPPGSTHEK